MRRALLLMLLGLPVWAATPAQVADGAARLYGARLASLRAAGDLDRDTALLARVRAIVARLAAVAPRALDWEVHVGGPAREAAFAMAGGRLLLSAEHVQTLDLQDAELALLLAHEMAHAYLLHHWQEAEQATRLDPRWTTRPYAELEWAIDHDSALMAALAPSNRAQEDEADAAGLQLVAAAGYDARAALGYFRKLAEASGALQHGDAEHRSPQQRLQRLRKLAATMR
ncbi:M48 family metalloprotease [Massilia sp. TS11]|uniref:M48 family metalloprotease n=1 Tax=Massilia sp. TS11 TaxID=2908003 RepID=UPI001EDC3B4D|nr:M48 family metalloprotease [Massilia sp. TS11]MCG2584407.1 M48 family metalloprotease [Massilia sp. TS11]